MKRYAEYNHNIGDNERTYIIVENGSTVYKLTVSDMFGSHRTIPVTWHNYIRSNNLVYQLREKSIFGSHNYWSNTE